jgi:SSS family solute:Na+ symporter
VGQLATLDWLLIGGAALVTAVGLARLGGWGAMRSLVDAGHFDMWKPMTDPSFPWTGILFGAPILGVWSPTRPGGAGISGCRWCS